MSTLRDIRAKIVQLLQGTAAGAIRMPAAGLFSVVGDDHLIHQADAADASPRPVYVEAGYSVSDQTIPSDVSGNYRWKARLIPIWIPYAYNPDDTVVERDSTMDDDEDVIERVLVEPLNIALVADWAKSYWSCSREPAERNEDGTAAIRWIAATLTVAYREDWET